MEQLVRVAVQHRHRFFREGLELLLEAEPGIVVVGTAVAGPDLVELCAEARPDVAVIEVDREASEVLRSCVTLRRSHAELRFVGVYGAEADAALARRTGLRWLVDRAEGFGPILGALRAATTRPPARLSIVERPDVQSVLSSRETDVLNLVGAGHTTQEIAERLTISRKTVENHKQRIFTKLDVQNQAHAVAVAVRRGLISPDGIIDLAAEG